MIYRNEAGQITPKIYSRIIWRNSWKMCQLIMFDLVVTLSKCMNWSDGGDKKWHLKAQTRKTTNL